MKRYLQYLKEYKVQCILGPLFKWIEAALELLVPLVMKDIIDTGVAAGDIGYVLRGGALMLVMGAVGFGCALFCQRSASIASQGFGTNVRNALFRHINTLSYREIDKVGASSLVTRVVNDVNQMQSAASSCALPLSPYVPSSSALSSILPSAVSSRRARSLWGSSSG